MKFSSLTWMLFLLPVLFSCKKGSIGPAGPTGPQGPVGTPNVIYSDWLLATNVRDTTIDNTVQKVADLKAPEITQLVLDKGLIQVYLKFNGQTAPLPYLSLSSGKASTISFLPRLGRFFITRVTQDGSNAITLPPDISYRYVIVPGGIQANGRTTAAAGPDWSNYASVAAYYHWQD